MPIVVNDTYLPPKFLFNRHLETIYPALFRKVEISEHRSLEIGTDDDDFLQLDWYTGHSQNNVIIVSHGLEGNSNKPYILGMARMFTAHGWDAIAWNYRGCGDKINRQNIFYHSGATYDLHTIVKFARNHYQNIFLIGFSLGGNLTLKYLAEYPEKNILGSTVFSVPLELYQCCLEMKKPHNFIYSRRFLLSLKSKIRAKKQRLNGMYPLNRLSKITNLFEFDDVFTAPLHGFKNALDYYEKCSSLYLLKKIKTPTLLVNAKNDPFLTPECYPHYIAHSHDFLYFEETNKGGHVGFSSTNYGNIYWSEKRALEFANGLLKE